MAPRRSGTRARARRFAARRSGASALACAALVGACGKHPDANHAPADAGTPVAVAPQGTVLEAAENEAPVAPSSARPAPKLGARERAEVPAGSFVAGSMPGDKGRDPVLEPALAKIELGAFSVDRYLYPNDPQQPPLTNVTRARAVELCGRAGGRLCTDAEWERACRGPDGAAYATGPAWDLTCAKEPTHCASGFGVFGMGAGLREWTSTDVAPIEKVLAGGAAVRGARADASGVDHRCAHRAAVDPTVASDDVGFRCCYGAPNAAALPAPKWDQTYRRAELTPAQAAQMFASIAQLKGLGTDITFFKEPDDVNAVLARGDAGAPPPNTTLTTAPLLWNPVPGEEVLVLAGRAQKDSFVVAFYRLPGERYRIASSFIMKDEKGPVALGFNGYVKRRLSWATCWDCRGESGNVTYREDNRVVITQK